MCIRDRFTVEKLWADLGIGEGAGERSHATVVADRSGNEVSRETAAEKVAAAVAAIAKAPDARELDKIDAHAKGLKIHSMKAYVDAMAARRAELDVDAWAPKDSVPANEVSAAWPPTAQVPA